MTKRFLIFSTCLLIALALFSSGSEAQASHEIIGSISFDGTITNVAVNPVTNRFYVGRSTPANELVVFDGANSAIITTVPLASAPTYIAVSHRVNEIFVLLSDQNKLVVIDGATNLIEREMPFTVTTYGNPRIRSIFVNPYTNIVYLYHIPMDQSFYIINGNSGAPLATYSCSSWSYPAFASNLRDYIICNSDSLMVLDATTGNRVAMLTFSQIAVPGYVVFNPSNNRIYMLSNLTPGTSLYPNVTIVDTTTNALVTSIRLPMSADSMVFSEATNQLYIWVTYSLNPFGGRTGEVHVMDTISNTITGRFPSLFDAASVAFNPHTGLIYATTYNNRLNIVSDTRLPAPTVAVPTSPPTAPPSPFSPQPFLTDNLSNLTEGAISVIGGSGNVQSNNTTGDTYARVLVQDGRFVRNPAEIGSAQILPDQVLQAVDLYGMLPGGASVVPFVTPVRVCLRGEGTILWLDAALTTRTPTPLPSTQEGETTCASVPGSGTVVLVAGGNGSPFPTTMGSTEVRALSGCRLTTLYMVNLREQPNTSSAILTTLPYDVGYEVTERTTAGDWYRVIYQDTQGWVNAGYVQTDGSCN